MLTPERDIPGIDALCPQCYTSGSSTPYVNDDDGEEYAVRRRPERQLDGCKAARRSAEGRS